MSINNETDKPNFWETWERFWYVVQASRRLDDLVGLYRWAKRKRLTGVQNHYRGVCVEELTILKYYRRLYPETTQWARGYYHLMNTLFPRPCYYKKGMGKAYRAENSRAFLALTSRHLAPENRRLLEIATRQKPMHQVTPSKIIRRTGASNMRFTTPI